jgi:hypothetical protein
MHYDLLSISKSFREKLLSRNLSYDGIDVSGVEPLTNSSISDRNQALYVTNKKHYEDNLKYNRYCPSEEYSYPTQKEIVKYSCMNGTYHDLLNQDAGKIKTINMVGAILSGKGVRIGGNGELSSNYDVKTSMVGNILSASGAMYDTPLGMVANQEVMKAFKNNTLARTQSEVLGRFNFSPINLLKGGSLTRPDYSITIGHNTKTKILETIGDLTGIQLPRKEFSDDVDFHQKGYSHALIKQTGKGQVQELFSNLIQNKQYGPKIFKDGELIQVAYAPNYDDKRIKHTSLIDSVSHTDIAKEFEGLTDDVKSYEDLIDAHPSSLLGKTKELFNKSSDKDLISTKSNNVWGINKEFGSVDTSRGTEGFTPVKVGGAHYISKGNQTLTESAAKGVGDGKIFARVFTKKNPYGKVGDLHRHRGLDYKDSTNSSVLDSNGFVKIGPQTEDRKKGKTAVRKYMFSLENLAWDGSDAFNNLPEIEQGPGDRVNGTKGRIMWFPPYGLSFNENSSVNWEGTNFINRGEAVYSYNNTERMGNLQFKLIIDYPSYMDDISQLVSEEELNRIIMGESIADYKSLSKNQKNDIELAKAAKKDIIMDVEQVVPENFEVYFASNNTNFDKNHELNTNLSDEFFENIKTLLTNCPSCEITITGYASGPENDGTANERAVNFMQYLKSYANNNRVSIKSSDSAFKPNESPKHNRLVTVEFKRNVVNSTENEVNIKPTLQNPTKTLSASAKRQLISEGVYFEKLEESSPLFYKELKNKVKHFHPAFHSITPEGFSSRLNFLLQCTRQGPTQNADRASNLAFGKPPVCILRIGDFYHTKIIIDNVQFSFDENLWDINPEGAGVQPMMCTVDLSFKIIGGSSLEGPINILQNAVSYNFFGNTEIYSDKAEKIVPAEPEDETLTGYKYSISGAAKDGITQKEVNDNKVVEPTLPEVDEAARVETSTTSVVEDDVDSVTLFNNINLKLDSITTSGNTLYFEPVKADTNITHTEDLEVEVYIAGDNQAPKLVGRVTITESALNNTEMLQVQVLNLQTTTELYMNGGSQLQIMLKYENHRKNFVHTAIGG